MTEKQLIVGLQELSQIKPRKEWVLLTKNQILGEEKPRFSFISFLKEIQKGERFTLLNIRKANLTGLIFQHKPAFATVLSLAILVGLFGFAQNSLPGDSLFPLKKITEKSQAVFVSSKSQLKYNLELANKRLDDLTKVAENNSVKNLAPAINEFQASVSKAAESLTKAGAEKNPQLVKEIVLEVKKLEEKTEKVKALGIEVGKNEQLDNALAKLVEREIEELEGKTLTEDQEKVLTQAKEDYQNGNYSYALEKILLLSQ